MQLRNVQALWLWIWDVCKAKKRNMHELFILGIERDKELHDWPPYWPYSLPTYELNFQARGPIGEPMTVITPLSPGDIFPRRSKGSDFLLPSQRFVTSIPMVVATILRVLNCRCCHPFWRIGEARRSWSKSWRFIGTLGTFVPNRNSSPGSI